MNIGKEFTNALSLQNESYNIYDKVKSLIDRIQPIVADTDIQGKLTFSIDNGGLINVFIIDSVGDILTEGLTLEDLFVYMMYHNINFLTREECKRINKWLD